MSLVNITQGSEKLFRLRPVFIFVLKNLAQAEKVGQRLKLNDEYYFNLSWSTGFFLLHELRAFITAILHKYCPSHDAAALPTTPLQIHHFNHFSGHS